MPDKCPNCSGELTEDSDGLHYYCNGCFTTFFYEFKKEIKKFKQEK